MALFAHVSQTIITVSDEDGNEGELYFLVTAFAEFSKRIIHLAFKTMLWVHPACVRRRYLRAQTVLPQHKFSYAWRSWSLLRTHRQRTNMVVDFVSLFFKKPFSSCQKSCVSLTLIAIFLFNRGWSTWKNLKYINGNGPFSGVPIIYFPMDRITVGSKVRQLLTSSSHAYFWIIFFRHYLASLVLGFDHTLFGSLCWSLCTWLHGHSFILSVSNMGYYVWD